MWGMSVVVGFYRPNMPPIAVRIRPIESLPLLNLDGDFPGISSPRAVEVIWSCLAFVLKLGDLRHHNT